MDFALHPQLRADTLDIMTLEISSVLLMNDARFPWCILVPRIADTRELHHLPDNTQAQVWSEIARTAGAVETTFEAHKMNIAALGNMVPQLHIHVIARSTEDAAWPGPVWGVGQAEAYDDAESIRRIELIRHAIQRA